MKNKKYKIFIMAVLLAVVSVACDFEVPNDPFAIMKNETVFSKEVDLKARGQLFNSPFSIELAFTPEEMVLFDAISWELQDDSGGIKVSKVDTAVVGEWNVDYSPKIDIPGLPVGDYQLVVTIFDTFEEIEGVISFNNAIFSRVFILDFFILTQKLTTKLEFLGLGVQQDGTSQDTGISGEDRVTNLNKGLTFKGVSNISQSILDLATTKVTYLLTKEGEATIESEPLVTTGSVQSNSLFAEEVNLKGWEWTHIDLLTDGLWVVELRLVYSDSVDGETDLRSMPYNLTIDTVAPTIKWDYRYVGGEIVLNESSDPILITDYPTFEWDSFTDEAREIGFRRWGLFSFEDGSAVFKSKESDLFYTGTNFVAINEGVMGFSPLVAGIQEISINAWDVAGNKATLPVKRRLVVIAPDTTLKAIVNPGFEEISGLASNVVAQNPNITGEEGSFKGWKCDIWARLTQGFFAETGQWNQNSRLIAIKDSEFNPDFTGPFTDTYHEWQWKDYYPVYVATGIVGPDGSSNVARYMEKFQVLTGTTRRYYRNTSGSIWQEGFQLQAHVKYDFSYWTRNGGDNPEIPFKGIIRGGRVSFSVNGNRGDSDFTEVGEVVNSSSKNEAWVENKISLIPDKTILVDLVLEKVDKGDSAGGWTHLDAVAFEVATDGIPTVDGTVLD